MTYASLALAYLALCANLNGLTCVEIQLKGYDFVDYNILARFLGHPQNTVCGSISRQSNLMVCWFRLEVKWNIKIL